MIVRRATIDDAAWIYECNVKSFKDYITLIGRTPGPMLEDYCEALKNHYLFVVEESGVRLGFALLKDSEEDYMWLDVLATSPEHRGKGAGGILLDYSEKFIMSMGKKQCRLYTHVKYVNSQEMYKHNGYEIYKRVQEDGFDRYYMKKDLI